MNKSALHLWLLMLNAGLLFAEDPIVPFDEKTAVHFSVKSNMGIFQQQSADYRTENPWDIGFGIRYKNLAALVYIPLSLNNNAFDMAVNFYFEKSYYETFIKRYTNFYMTEMNEMNEDDETGEHENSGLDIMLTGIMAGWVHNHKSHSLRSVFTLSEKQTVSSGSFLYGFGAFYTSIYAQNAAISRYTERQHIVYFGPTAGYSYTWILPHNMFLNVGFTMGANLGINMTDTRMLFIPQINPKITFGHHHSSWSINTVMGCNASLLLWSIDDSDTLAPATMSLTFSKRF